MSDPLANIVRDARLLHQALGVPGYPGSEGLLLRRARQLADVTGDNLQAQSFDDEQIRQKKNQDPSWKIHRFVRSPRRHRDKQALEEMERHLRNAVGSVKAALVAGDKAVRLDWEETPDRREACVGCGERKILTSTTHCVTCEPKVRRGDD